MRIRLKAYPAFQEVAMPRCSAIALAILLLAIPSTPKDKQKSSLPAAILRAQFVAVIVDPDAGIPLMSPGEQRGPM
jgi:hypothetical protein